MTHEGRVCKNTQGVMAEWQSKYHFIVISQWPPMESSLVKLDQIHGLDLRPNRPLNLPTLHQNKINHRTGKLRMSVEHTLTSLMQPAVSWMRSSRRETA